MTPLHAIGNFFRDLLSEIPLSAVRALFLLTFLALLVWVVLLPRSAARQDQSSPWTQDLRIWASLALLIQILIYSVL